MGEVYSERQHLDAAALEMKTFTKQIRACFCFRIFFYSDLVFSENITISISVYFLLLLLKVNHLSKASTFVLQASLCL